ncbi:MAG: ABC transporter permease [Chitinispirillaceae bacterium]|nr:ABC transporter permease [Chitinispirillaceae bacterium]
MRNAAYIVWCTSIDQLRQKSFLVCMGMGILLVLLLRTCYNGTWSMNGQQVNGATIAWHASLMAFQVIITAMYLVAILLAMRLFGRDRDDGSLVLFLSRPVARWQYALGRIAGVWVLSTAGMFVLHLTIFCIMWTRTGGTIPGFLSASLVCSINLLFIIGCTSLFALFIPEIVAALAGIFVIGIGFVSDGGFQFMNSALVRAAISPDMMGTPALWRIAYPKVFMVQSWAGSLITGDEFTGMGPVHPVMNVALYCVVLVTLLVVSFNRKEI